jgi:hypothetical protein
MAGTKIAADDKPTRPEKELQEPVAKAMKCEDGQADMVFDKEGAQQLSRIIEDYHTLWLLIATLDRDIASMKREIIFLKTRVDFWKDAASEMKVRGDLYVGMWKTDHKLRLGAEKRYVGLMERRQKYGWIPWGIVALEAIFFGVVILAK